MVLAAQDALGVLTGRADALVRTTHGWRSSSARPWSKATASLLALFPLT